jgi:hypothetical protein
LCFFNEIFYIFSFSLFTHFLLSFRYAYAFVHTTNRLPLTHTHTLSLSFSFFLVPNIELITLFVFDASDACDDIDGYTGKECLVVSGQFDSSVGCAVMVAYALVAVGLSRLCVGELHGHWGGEELLLTGSNGGGGGGGGGRGGSDGGGALRFDSGSRTSTFSALFLEPEH